MAKCPHCGIKLHIWNVKAECPKCGVNIANYDWERRLEEDSVVAEAAFAKLHESMRRFKFSFVGTKLRIARIPVSVLPLFSFLLPLGTLAVSIPYFEQNFTLNAITIVKNIINLDLGGLISAPGSAVIGAPSLRLLLALLFVALSALSLPVSLVFLLLNFKKFDSKGLFVTNLLASLMMAASAVCFHSFNTLMAQTTLADAVSGGVSWGVFVSSALFLLSAIVNLIVALRPVTLPPEEKKDDEADNTCDNAENAEASPAEEVTA